MVDRTRQPQDVQINFMISSRELFAWCRQDKLGGAGEVQYSFENIFFLVQIADKIGPGFDFAGFDF
ncbi:MAG: hypothetical protein ABLQ96_04580, partial [Candidatus Acidiferrum sp.]